MKRKKKHLIEREPRGARGSKVSRATFYMKTGAARASPPLYGIYREPRPHRYKEFRAPRRHRRIGRGPVTQP